MKEKRTVAEVMSSPVVTADMDAPLGKVYDFFKKKGISHLVIMEKTRIVGVISDRDVLKEISPYVGTAAELSRDSATTKKRAHQIMSRQPVCVAEKASILEAIQLILKHSVSCLPVVDEHNKLTGIVSWKDLLRRFMDELRDREDGIAVDFRSI